MKRTFYAFQVLGWLFQIAGATLFGIAARIHWMWSTTPHDDPDQGRGPFLAMIIGLLGMMLAPAIHFRGRWLSALLRSGPNNSQKETILYLRQFRDPAWHAGGEIIGIAWRGFLFTSPEEKLLFRLSRIAQVVTLRGRDREDLILGAARLTSGLEWTRDRKSNITGGWLPSLRGGLNGRAETTKFSPADRSQSS